MSNLTRQRLIVAARGLSWVPRKSPSWSPQSRSELGYRLFHGSARCHKIQPYLLADIGEGITECRVVQWFVKPGDRVNQFDAICEVQSDKASVEITSRYDGVINALHHQVDDMAIVGKPLLDIDVEDETLPSLDAPPKIDSTDTTSLEGYHSNPPPTTVSTPSEITTLEQYEAHSPPTASPAVRHMMKMHNIDMNLVQGSGKGGRVLKEDLLNHLAKRDDTTPPPVQSDAQGNDTIIPLSPTDSQMFKVMTKALSIPHFGYSHWVDLTSLNAVRRKFNTRPEVSSSDPSTAKLSALPFILKALSLTFTKHPRVNSHLDEETDPNKPHVILKHSHDFGIAVDTPNGLLVPVVKGVQTHSIVSLAAEIKRLSNLAKEGRLSPSDMKGATFTVSNIGSIGGSVISPVVVPPMVAIVGVGRVEDVPTFVETEGGETRLVKREKVVLSWSADHRVLDGAYIAKCAKDLVGVLENIEELAVKLR